MLIKTLQQTFNDVVEDIQAHAERFREEYDISSLKVIQCAFFCWMIKTIKKVSGCNIRSLQLATNSIIDLDIEDEKNLS